MGVMKEMQDNSALYGGNAPFIEEQYELYLGNPAQVSEEWRAYFDRLQKMPGAVAMDVPHAPVVQSFAERARHPCVPVQGTDVDALVNKQIAVLQLINAYRFRGMMRANVDPLKRRELPDVPELLPEFYGLNDADLSHEFKTGSFLAPESSTLHDILRILRETYCGNIGSEYMYLSDTMQKRWIQDRIEPNRAQPQFSPESKRRILEQLTAAETLEKYLHTRYVGQKRFSLEGSDSLIPLLNHLIQRAGSQGVQEMVIGMAHRGRLNVLVNTIGKLPCDLFLEFEGKHTAPIRLPSGDVKYHQGFSTDVATPGGSMHLTLAFNPSHLEIVNPVVEGSVRARQQRRYDMVGDQVVPVLIHGDAAFAGQGVVMETLNLSKTRGFGTGGTVHIVINNQIGFTTSDPRDTRSTLYCTDVAKMVGAPIFHVNGDDPEAVLLVTEIALDFRMNFHKDVVIDLVCYRRLGHNEQDEPMVTQPLMYKAIAQHPTTRQLYADRLIAENVLSPHDPEEMIAAYRRDLDAGVSVNRSVLTNFKQSFATDWAPFKKGKWTDPANTSVPKADLRRLSGVLTTTPPNFKLHPRVEKIIADRRLMGEGKLPLDWGMAENLAYATLLENGFAVRLSGQDSGRGTFFHRHAVLHDQNREKWDDGAYLPLQNIAENQPRFLAIDSVLSEEAVLGFEYGYASAEPNELVIWEAQFGDFANGAQVVIDQFISAGEAKWGRLCGLVMLLPHGFEGQGPEHSSARPERYLQLCAEDNIQVCMPTTAAQIFHLLRRQMVRPYRKPLIVMTPKSLLRHKDAMSSLEDLAKGKFHPVIGEVDVTDPDRVTRVVACSGKVYYDLLAARRERNLNHIAIIRIEQLYPFPVVQFTAELQRYKKIKELVWAQEEPMNQGAWYQTQHHVRECLSANQPLFYAGRPASASPAVGYAAKHQEQQQALIDAALNKFQ
ncbi:MAG: 2-oxoglutarate dehydrogenase E1 component [Gammaproteobacteria bacterium]|nr:2-oxoglutarate dehydrogenase E1 component [Gammaproteobacteria bacterium]